MSAIEIARQDLSISQLRAEAARTADASRRGGFLAICHGAGWSFAAVGRAGQCHGPATLRDWVHRYNADGLAGLADRPRPGRQPRLARSPAERSGEVGWKTALTSRPMAWCAGAVLTCVTALPPNSMFICMSAASASLLKKLNFSSMSVRPVHPQSDLEAQEAFKKTSLSWRAPQSRRKLAGRPVEIWFQDEARVGQQGHADPHLGQARHAPAHPARPAVHLGLSVRRHLPGHAAPAAASGHAGCQYRTHEQHLAEISKCVSVSAIALLNPRRCWLAQFATTPSCQEYRAHAASVLRA